MIRRTQPISWYWPKLVLNRAGLSFQIWWKWRAVRRGKGSDGIPVFVVTLWWRPLRLRRYR